MAEILHNLTQTLLSPMVLAFALGVFATLIKSDLKFPEELYITLTLYLLFAIGMKGGYKMSLSSLEEAYRPILLAISLGIVIPIGCYLILRKICKFDIANSAAVAAHFGSVSAVTFGEGLAFLDNLHIYHEGFLPALLAIMEIPAILVSIFIGRYFLSKNDSQATEKTQWKKIIHELFTGKSTLLLLGGMVIGYLSGEKGFGQTAAFFDAPFRGILTLFLLEVGLVTGRRLKDVLEAGPKLLLFGITLPVIHGIIGVYCGYLIDLSLGGATIMGILAASASYIAAPAAVRIALPEANPSIYLTASLAIAFPFNVTFGLPLYFSWAKFLFHT